MTDAERQQRENDFNAHVGEMEVFIKARNKDDKIYWLKTHDVKLSSDQEKMIRADMNLPEHPHFWESNNLSNTNYSNNEINGSLGSTIHEGSAVPDNILPDSNNRILNVSADINTNAFDTKDFKSHFIEASPIQTEDQYQSSSYESPNSNAVSNVNENNN